ncbi:MAG: carboxypeptidase-like regulatory domain-containing protein [Pyrinomonadaceae bacterium]
MFLCGFALALTAVAQSGGTYVITQSVIAGGGQASSGGTFAITGTTGQPAAGTYSAEDPYVAHGGFWHSEFLPTAAGVDIAGQLVTSDGRGIRNATILLMGTDSTTRRMTLSGSFGYFRFEGVVVGQTYILTVQSKRFRFSPQVLNVLDNITDLKLVALP